MFLIRNILIVPPDLLNHRLHSKSKHSFKMYMVKTIWKLRSYTKFVSFQKRAILHLTIKLVKRKMLIFFMKSSYPAVTDVPSVLWIVVGVSRQLLHIPTLSVEWGGKCTTKVFENSFCHGLWLCAQTETESDVTNLSGGKQHDWCFQPCDKIPN